MKQEYNIGDATAADEASVREIFKSAEAEFHLADTMLASLIEGTICNYSEGLGWGFGLGALRAGSVINIGLNPCKATPERYRPVFDYVVSSLRQGFGGRLIPLDPAEQIDLSKLPRIPIAEANREFFRNLLAAEKSPL